MDGRSIFLHMVACEVVTDLDAGSPLSDWGPRGTSRGAGKSAPPEARPRTRAKGKPSSEARGPRSREKLLAQARPSRTENGHTWSRRVS